LRRSKGKTPKTSKAPQSAPPSEPSTSMAAQCSTTDLENSESENPPLVDPRYSGLREETEPPTEGSTETDEELEPFVAGIQAEGQNLTPKSSPTHTPDIILTSAPTTDELATTEDANNTTEVVETGLSEDDLLKAAAEIDISQRIIERRAYEAEDIIDEKDLELTTVVERSCLSDGTAVDEETREYLDSIDPYDEVHNNDRTLSERVEKLIRETQTKNGTDMHHHKLSNDGRSHRRYKHPAHKQQPRIILRGLRISGTEKGNLASRHLLKYYGVDQGTSTAPILYTIGTPLLLENSHPKFDLFKTTDILQQFRIIQQLQEKIKVARQTTIPPNTLRNPLSVRLRKSAPLAIIGTLSKSLFGTATEDEINIIQTSLKSLFQEQSDLVKLNKEKTHLLMRSMDTVANVTQRHEELLVELDGILRSETTEIEHLQYEVRLLAHFSAIAKGMENRIRSLEQIEIILRELRSGRIPSQLLTQSIAQEIAIDIQQNNPDLEIPIPREHLRPEEILKISTADMIYIDGHTTAIIYIPLTERTQYKLYKLHPLEIPQFSPNHTPIGTAFIRPAHPYLLLSATHKQYIMYDNENLKKCLQGHSSYVCPIQSPVKEWHYLSHDGSWLYSTTEAETIELICPDKREESAKMTGIGILKIQPGCHARTRDHLLETEEVRRSQHNYVYDTDTHLNITHLFPQIKTSWHLITSMSTNSNPATKWKEEAVKIETLLKQIDAVDTQAREKRSTMSLVAGGILPLRLPRNNASSRTSTNDDPPTRAPGPIKGQPNDPIATTRSRRYRQPM
ncbi:unnamed protein product, partial [Trichogramma brassicae]